MYVHNSDAWKSLSLSIKGEIEGTDVTASLHGGEVLPMKSRQKPSDVTYIPSVKATVAQP